MIRFRVKEIIADREFRSGKRLTLEEISKATGIHRTTLSKISGVKGYNTTTYNIDVLCKYFDCTVDKIMEYVPDDLAAHDE